MKKAIEFIAKGNKTPYDSSLKSCKHCGCFNAAQIWIPIDALQSTVKDERKRSFAKPLLEKGMNYGANQLPLENISEDGTPPESRLSSPDAVVDLVQMMIRSDEERNRIRAKVKGIVDGNPPYSPAQLKRTGQSYRTNVNFREAEAFFSCLAHSVLRHLFRNSQLTQQSRLTTGAIRSE